MTKQEKVKLIQNVLSRLTIRLDAPSSAVLFTFDTTSHPSFIELRNYRATIGAIHMSELEAIVDEVA